MKSANPHPAGIDRQHRTQPHHHLFGCFIGECHRQNTNGGNLTGLDQPSDAGGEYPRLAAASTGQDQSGLGMAIFGNWRKGHRLALFWV